MNRSLADKIRDFGRALSVEEVSGIIPFNVSTLYRMANSHRIPAFRMGGRIWFDCYQLATWFEESAVV